MLHCFYSKLFIMQHTPIDSVFNIISFLPFATQAKICKKTRDAVAVDMINIIKRSIKYNKRRIMNLLENETDKVNVLQAAHCLYHYKNENEIRDVIESVLQHKEEYPKAALDIVKMGFLQGWSNKKIHRHMVSKLDYDGLFMIGW